MTPSSLPPTPSPTTIHRSRLATLAGLVGLAALSACSSYTVTGAAAPSAQLGRPSSTAALEAQVDQPGPVTVEKVVAADWSVPLSGPINLAHPAARAAGLRDREEAIQIYFYALRHPRHGLFIVDSGVERALRRDRKGTVLSGLLASFMHSERIRIHVDTASWLAARGERLAGVLLTHLHLDHVLGLPDVSRGTPVFVGPGETRSKNWLTVFARGTTDRALAGHDLRTLGAPAGPAGADGLMGVTDVFGDGSLFALHVPGHTGGHLAFVARTPTGPVLLTGDACHTAWGWQNGVEPGSFSEDRPRSASSLAALRALAARHPSMRVHPGHQSLPAPATR